MRNKNIDEDNQMMIDDATDNDEEEKWREKNIDEDDGDREMMMTMKVLYLKWEAE